MSDVVRLRVGGEVFEVEKESLLRFDHTFFHGLFSSGAWQPDADGAYFIDRPAMGFGRILEYLSSGKLSLDGLSDLEKDCVYSSLDYLLIPYRRQWLYNTAQVIEGFRADFVCELKGGRLCGVNGNDIIVWNMDISAIAMTLIGHTGHIQKVIELQDGRVCTCSSDRTIKVWSVDSGLCELTLTGHTETVFCTIQLSDGRLCSGSRDMTLRVWNALSGVSEMTMHTQHAVQSIAQLSDGRVCCGGSLTGTISIYSLLTEECELSWYARSHFVHAIVCIDATRICVGSFGGLINVWSTATGKCERTFYRQTQQVNSMVLMHDGRLCSASADGTLKLWNLETGKCEKTLGSISNSYKYHNVMQLSDGRLVSCFTDYKRVRLWR